MESLPEKKVTALVCGISMIWINRYPPLSSRILLSSLRFSSPCLVLSCLVLSCLVLSCLYFFSLLFFSFLFSSPIFSPADWSLSTAIVHSTNILSKSQTYAILACKISVFVSVAFHPAALIYIYIYIYMNTSSLNTSIPSIKDFLPFFTFILNLSSFYLYDNLFSFYLYDTLSNHSLSLNI